jgi:fatty acid synthase subunit alpha
MPVRWTETQDLLLSDFQTRKTVEIGPAETLTNMMKRTRELVYKPYDTANSISRDFLSLKKNKDDIYFMGEQKTARNAPRRKETPSALSNASLAPPTNGTSLNIIPPTPTVASHSASPAPAPIAAGPVEDAPVSAGEIIKTIVSITLKKPAKDVAFDQSVKALSGGRSTLQNEITGDLDAEFGGAPDGAEELPLSDLASIVQKNFSGSLGKRTKSLVDKLFTSKMPGGFSPAKAREMLESDYGFASGRQDSVLLMALQSPPAARLGSDAEARAFWSSTVNAYIAVAGIQINKAAAGQPGAAAVAVSVDPKALDALNKRSNDFNREVYDAYSRHLGEDNHAMVEEVAQLKSDMQSLQNELDLWNLEHGNEYANGIKPYFDKRKARVYDSFWNWALQDLFKIYHGVRQGYLRLESEEVARRRQALLNRSSKRLINVLAHMIGDMRKQQTRSIASEIWFEDLLEDCSAAIRQAPLYLASSTVTAPRTTIDATGAVKFIEQPVARGRSRSRSRSRSRANSAGPVSEQSVESREFEAAIAAKNARGFAPQFNMHAGLMPPTPSMTPTLTPSITPSNASDAGSDLVSLPDNPSVRDEYYPIIQQKTDGVWKECEELSNQYGDILDRAVDSGLAFQGKNILVTGAGKGSIGAKIVQGLLSGGAKVIVTTSSYAKSTKFYQQMFTKFGAKGSSLMVVPYNAGSNQDTEGLIDYIYSFPEAERDLDHIIPFAAISETANGIELGPKSELAHRMMLTNTLRLLGAVKKAKEARRITTRPAQVILPLSPNHGVFGGDGLYSESKLGLEGLLNKWHTEDWSEYLSVCGAIIGWTRGTGLMNDNDMVAEGVESLGVKTFSQDEMAVNIMGLMASPLLEIIQSEPLLADLSGGMSTFPNLKEEVAIIRKEISEISSSRRALVKEQKAEFDTPLVAAAPNTLAPFKKRANIKFNFPKLPDFTSEIEQLSALEGMVDLEKVVVVVGFGEVGPHGSSRTRWQMESQGQFTLEGYIEMAWMMGLIEYQSGDNVPYSGWIEKDTKKSINDAEIKQKYEEHILKHSGIRILDARTLDGPDPASRQVLHEIDLQHDFAPFEVSKETAADLLRENGSKVTIKPIAEGDTCIVTLHKGARLMVPKSLAFDRTVGGQVPTGWCAKTYGISDDIINQVDPATLYALVCTAEALLSAGVTDPYEFYKYIHVSQLGVCVGSGFGGAASLQGIYKERYTDKTVQNDVLAESFINTGSAWINMLLLSSCGPNITPVGACATALESLDVGFEVISSGKAKAVLVGGYDYLAKDVAYEFANMKATVNTDEDFARGRTPAEMSRPATTTRSGFVESEGCGIQLLTTAALALEMGLPIHGVIAMTRTASDKAGRSLPAPGRGIINAAGSSKSTFDSPLLNMSYRKRQIDMRMAQIKENETSELDYLNQELESYKAGAVDFDIEEYRQHRLASIRTDTTAQRSEVLNSYGNEFWKRDTKISPMRGALATWGLTADDIQVASFHGTSTVKNELNECGVIQEQMTQLGRAKGNPVLAVFQKHLTGHPKGAAAAWMLNGALQIMDSGLIPGNKNADNIDDALEKFDHIAFPSETIHTSEDVKAFIVSSFGFGQKGAQAIGVHPKFLFAAAGREKYAEYLGRVKGRQNKAYHHFHKSMMTNTMFRAKDDPPYTKENETEFLTNHDSRLPMDMVL